mmetsp:Transcript_123463/g.354739  ORF Transcript_123463/g.354739 Transcript_123463/m.354739 type:complete len:300 (+) Transcript_123463:649-1548(+)
MLRRSPLGRLCGEAGGRRILGGGGARRGLLRPVWQPDVRECPPLLEARSVDLGENRLPCHWHVGRRRGQRRGPGGNIISMPHLDRQAFVQEPPLAAPEVPRASLRGGGAREVQAQLPMGLRGLRAEADERVARDARLLQDDLDRRVGQELARDAAHMHLGDHGLRRLESGRRRHRRGAAEGRARGGPLGVRLRRGPRGQLPIPRGVSDVEELEDESALICLMGSRDGRDVVEVEVAIPGQPNGAATSLRPRYTIGCAEGLDGSGGRAHIEEADGRPRRLQRLRGHDLPETLLEDRARRD